VNLTAQKSRYPRSHSNAQSANSRQKAKRPSSGKRKTSSSSSYSKSEQPFSVKYVSTSYRISSQRPPWRFVWEWLVGLSSRDSIAITESVAWRWRASHLPGGHFLLAVHGHESRAEKSSRRAENRHPRPVVRWVLVGRPTTERSGVSEEDALRRTREEIAQLEAERVRLSTDVMEGRPEALEEDERLRERIVELGHWLWEAEKEGGGRRGMGEGPRPPQPPPVPPDAFGGGD
jgi:hypothetical protein